MSKNKADKCRNAQKNRIVIHKEDKEKRVYLDELPNYYNQGWKKGASMKHRQTQSKIRVGESTSVKGRKYPGRCFSTTWKKGNIPWNKGSTGSVPWNKGLTRETNDIVMQASLKKQGHVVTEKTRAKISAKHVGKKVSKEMLQIKLSKSYITRKRNDSFNKSFVEEQFYTELLKLNRLKTIYRQYKDIKRYPYYCDFYIVEDDLFIELNAHWTHGGKPYDVNDPICQKQLAEWQEKAKTSQFYKNAIETWTIRDVEKLKIAQKNKLNYKVIY